MSLYLVYVVTHKLVLFDLYQSVKVWVRLQHCKTLILPPWTQFWHMRQSFCFSDWSCCSIPNGVDVSKLPSTTYYHDHQNHTVPPRNNVDETSWVSVEGCCITAMQELDRRVLSTALHAYPRNFSPFLRRACLSNTMQFHAHCWLLVTDQLSVITVCRELKLSLH
jgi:hypothetical protein